ncbi:MAG: ergothioneine biosynthesis protein EgtC [Actinomycetota bacterium]
MCRLLAYLGPQLSLGALLLEPPYSLEYQSYAPRFQHKGRFNADGFGVGWYDHAVRPEPARYRRAVPMWSDRNFASLAGIIHSGAFLASLRNATPPSPSEETSTAPYLSGTWLFAHNGEVTDFARGVKRKLLRSITPRRAEEIAGTADSEVLFAMVLDCIDAGAGAAEALVSVVTTIMEGSGGFLNMILTDGRSLAATACGDSLFERHSAEQPLGVVIASEPFDDTAEWTPVPEGSVVFVDGDVLRTEPLFVPPVDYASGWRGESSSESPVNFGPRPSSRPGTELRNDAGPASHSEALSR